MNLPDAIDCIRPSVIQFSFRNKENGNSQPFGSGFILDREGHIATAAHVVQSAQQHSNEGSAVRVGLAVPNMERTNVGNLGHLKIQRSFCFVAADPLAVDAEHDVAVLRLNPNPFANPPRPMIKIGDTFEAGPLYKECSTAPERPREGDAIAVSGYPLNLPALVTTAGYLASVWQKQDTPASDGFTEVSTDVYMADVSVNPGNSGGPVYRLSDGHVIGVCVAHWTAPLHFVDSKGGIAWVDGRPVGINAGLSVVVPIQHVINLLGRPNGAA